VVGLLYIFIFIFGACLGSFSNVLINRTQKGKTILGRSKCDRCKYTLSWYDNIPVISFLILKGSCRKCKKKISWDHFWMEISTGLIMVLSFWLLGRGSQLGLGATTSIFYWDILYYLTIIYILWVIFVWDLKFMIIPDFLVLIGLVLTLVYEIGRWFVLFGFDINGFLLEKVAGSLLIGFFFGAMFYFSKGRWIGGGDVKIGFWLGLIVGAKMVYFFLLFSYVLGAGVAIFLLLFSKKKMKSQIPFGPFLIVATYLIIFYQDLILAVWSSLLSLPS